MVAMNLEARWKQSPLNGFLYDIAMHSCGLLNQQEELGCQSIQ